MPFPEVESLVALVSPSPTKDASSIGDSNRNTTSGFVVTSFHGTRSHDRGTLALWTAGKSIHEIAEAMKPISRVFVHRTLTTKFKSQYDAGQKARSRIVETPKYMPIR